MATFLSDKEVESITRRKRGDAQARVLLDAGISFRMVDGRPLVPAEQFQHTPKPFEPQLVLVR